MKVIFDIDGTIADISKILPLWDTDKELFFSRLGEAKPIEKTIRLFKMFWEPCYSPSIYTARPERTRHVTNEWLTREGIYYDVLMMPKDNDTRHDKDTKLSMLQEHGFKPENTIIFEDRTCVVQHLRQHGYTVCQVDDGNY